MAQTTQTVQALRPAQTAQRLQTLREWFRVPPADVTVDRWHVGPAVDLVAYAFSWLWVLVTLLLLGNTHPTDYLLLYFLVISLNFTHRHFTLPYVYLDREVFAQHPLKFSIFAAFMLFAFAASPALWRWSLPAHSLSPARLSLLGSGALLVAALLGLAVTWRHGLRGRHRRGPHIFFTATLALSAIMLLALGWWLDARGPAINFPSQPFRFNRVLAGVAFFAGLWNLWHVYSQKYGILRLYNAKNGMSSKVPGWVDRLLIFGWLPLYFAWIGPTYRDELHRYFPTARAYLMPLVDTMKRWQPWLLAPAIVLVLMSIGLFLLHEHRIHRWRNAPRLWMAMGMTGLSASFLLFNPVKVYMAFAFSHAIEYMVFVWAYQRRRYLHPLAHRPLLQRALRHPVIAYGGFTLAVAGGYLLLRFTGRYILPHQSIPELFGTPLFRWIFYWGVYQSMVHFYYDGFLWKMRMPSVRANL